MTVFTPDKNDPTMQIPYFEDAQNADGVIGYTTRKSQKELKSLITAAFGRLGGSVVGFVSGKYGTRYGFQIQFTFEGVPGRIDVAALPIRNETDSRVDQAKRHALYSVYKRLEHQYNSLLVMPGDVPLVPWLLNAEGQTVTEWLRDLGKVPELPEPEQTIVEGEFEDYEQE